MSKIKGIDISYWQGDIDFKKVKMSDDIKFAILREGYRQTTDKKFFDYVYGCRTWGIKIEGVYHFIYMLNDRITSNAETGRLNAESCLRNIRDAQLRKDEIIVWCDLEYDTVTQTYTLEEVKKLLAAARNSRIHVQVVLALLMGLRRSEINGLKYSDIDFTNHKMHLDRQLGEDLHADPETIPPKMKTKQEIPLKTKSSYREMDIPDYVYWVLVEERKKYEKNRSRRQHGRWIFQDLDYVCCSSYGRPRSKTYHYQHYAELIKEAELPYIKFHDLRHTYTTILMKNNINQRAIATALGHSKSIITVDTYTDMKMIIEDCVEELQVFISEIHPYDMTDKKMLEEMFHETIALEDSGDAVHSRNHIPGIVIYDYSDVYEMEDIAEWYMG